jgi:F-type H+-transporting ATPase subunit epsilon
MKTAHTFTLIISKVNESLFNGEAYSVTLPGSEGELTILAGHEPLITILKKGTITIRHGNDEITKISVEKGLLETSNGQVTVLV